MTNEHSGENNDTALAYLLLRATLGVNIMIHGLSRILSGQGKFAATLIQGFHDTLLPGPLVAAFAYSLPWIEAALGALLLLGLFTRFTLVAGSLLILILTFGSTLRQDWESAGLQLIYAAVYAGLLAYRQRNQYSLDSLRKRN